MKKKVDILKLDIPNVCFSRAGNLPKDDKRLKKFKKQRMLRGFDDSELWNLDITIAKFILPRLKAAKDQVSNDAINYDIMIAAFEKIIVLDVCTNENSETIDKGLTYFADHFCSLWN